MRKAPNWIRKIKDDDDDPWKEDEEEVAQVFMDYFSNIFKTRD